VVERVGNGHRLDSPRCSGHGAAASSGRHEIARTRGGQVLARTAVACGCNPSAVAALETVPSAFSAAWLSALLAVSSSIGCAAATAAAAKDPMKCERDPKCASHQKAFDCSTQCTDDPACVERCSEIQSETGTSAAH